MDDLNVIDKHTERQMDPNLWVSTFIFYSLIILLAIAFIIGPPILLIIYKKAWMLLLFLLILLGFWMIRGVSATLRLLIWKNHHLSSYMLEKGKIHAKEWVINERFPREDTIDFTSIHHIVLSKYLVKNNDHHSKSRQQQSGKQTTAVPILNIVYKNRGSDALLTIPFQFYSNVNTWLQTFQDNHIPLYYEESIMTGSDEADRLAHLNDTAKLNPYTYNGHTFPPSLSIISNREYISRERKQKTDPTSRDRTTVKTSDQIEQQHQPKKEKVSAKQWSLAALVSYSILIVGIYIFILMTEQGIIAENSFFTILLFFIVSYLYFSILRPFLRWYHMIRFLFENFVICLIVAMAFADRSNPAEEITSMFLGLSMIFIFVVWIPYLIAKKRKQPKA